MKGPTSTGKTYVSTEVLNLFPEGDVLFLRDMTPKAIVNEVGTRIGKNGMPVLEHDEDGVPRKLKDIQKETHHILIDVSSKIFLFLDTPRPETLSFLLPMLSHDRWEWDYKSPNVDTRVTERMRVRGWPVVISCTTETEPFAELANRGLTYTPERNLEKIKAAGMLQGDMAAQPWAYNDEHDPEREEIRKALRRIREFAKRGDVRLCIPYATQLASQFPWREPRDMRDHPNLQKLIKSSAMLDYLQRPWIRFDEHHLYVVTNGTDYERGRTLYNAVIELSKSELNQEIIDFYTHAINGIEKQHYEDLQTSFFEIHKRSIGTNRLYENYILPLKTIGWVNTEKDPDDKRMRLILDVRSDGESVESIATEFPGLFKEKQFGEWYFGLQNYISRNQPVNEKWRLAVRLPNEDEDKWEWIEEGGIGYDMLYRVVSERYISEALLAAERARNRRNHPKIMSRQNRQNFQPNSEDDKEWNPDDQKWVDTHESKPP